MKQFFPKLRIWMIICLQILILGICAVATVIHENRMISYDIPLECSLDETMGAEIYEIIPAEAIFLPKGHYRCRLSYSGGSEESYLLPGFSDADSFCEIQAHIFLREGLSAGEDEFWLEEDMAPGFSIAYSGVGQVSVESLHIEQTSAPDRMRMFGLAVLFLAADLLCCLAKKKALFGSVQNKAMAAGLLLLILLTSYPLTLGYPISGDDMDFHMGRIEGMAESFREGQIPQRLNPVFFEGYGYANPVFYGELFLVFPAVMRLTGFRLTTCYMVYTFLINVLTCLLSCYCFSKISGRKEIGLAVSFLYCLAPYRLMDVYCRSAAGEYTAMAFLPLVFWGMYRIYACDTDASEYKRSFLPLLAGLSGIMQSHTLTGEMTAAFVLLTCVVFCKRTFQKKRFLELLKAAVGTILVNAWFLVPFLDMALTVPVKSLQAAHFRSIQDHGAFWAQIIGLFGSALRNTALPNQGIVGEMPFTAGTALLAGQFLCVFMLSARKQLAGKSRAAGGPEGTGSPSLRGHRYAVCGIFALIMTFLASWMSTVHFPWDGIAGRIPALALPITSLQYPWRLLTMAVLFASAATGIGLVFLKENLEKYYVPVLTVLVSFAVIGGMYAMQAPMQSNFPYTSNNLKKVDSCVSGGYEEYLPVESDGSFIHTHLGTEVVGGVKILDYQKAGCTVWLDVDAAEGQGNVILPLLAYQGYRCERMDEGNSGQAAGAGTDKELLVCWEDGRLTLSLEKGFEGRLKVSFREPVLWRAAEIVSLISIILICLYVRGQRDKRKPNPHIFCLPVTR